MFLVPCHICCVRLQFLCAEIWFCQLPTIGQKKTGHNRSIETKGIEYKEKHNTFPHSCTFNRVILAINLVSLLMLYNFTLISFFHKCNILNWCWGFHNIFQFKIVKRTKERALFWTEADQLLVCFLPSVYQI